MAGKIAVTGGAGLIGSAFVARLNQDGVNDIVIVDALRTGEKWKNLVPLRFADYMHKDAFLEHIKRGTLPFEPSAIVHMGACSSTTERDADYLMANNYEYSKVLARYCLDRSIRFIYASSAATYGLGESGYEDDETKLRDLKPLNMYGYSKHLFDLWLKENGLLQSVAGLKFFNVFGPHEHHKGDMRSMVLKAYEQITSTGKVRLFESAHPQYRDGEQMRDFVYVKDCAEVLFWLLKNPAVNGLFNLGAGRARTWNDLVTAVFLALGRSPNIEYVPMPEQLRSQYQYFTEAPMQRLRAAGFAQPFMPLEDAIADYVKGHLHAPTHP